VELVKCKVLDPHAITFNKKEFVNEFTFEADEEGPLTLLARVNDREVFLPQLK
jgi:hypothetical protein